MTLLDSSTWEGRIFCGEWISGSGQEYEAVEPATGATLGRLGSAAPADVDKAVERAVQAQREWAARPYSDRAAGTSRRRPAWPPVPSTGCLLASSPGMS